MRNEADLHAVDFDVAKRIRHFRRVRELSQNFLIGRAGLQSAVARVDLGEERRYGRNWRDFFNALIQVTQGSFYEHGRFRQSHKAKAAGYEGVGVADNPSFLANGFAGLADRIKSAK